MKGLKAKIGKVKRLAAKQEGQSRSSNEPCLNDLIGEIATDVEELQRQLDTSRKEHLQCNKDWQKKYDALLKKYDASQEECRKLKAALGNRSISNRKANNENINGKGSERTKGIDSSSKEKKPYTKPKTFAHRDVKEVNEEVYIDVDGKEISKADALAKIGTVYVGSDGRRYKYTSVNKSSVKDEIEVTVKHIQYNKLQVVLVDENGNKLPDSHVNVTEHPLADFFKKTAMSIGLMSWIIAMWMYLKLPVYRISRYISGYGLNYSRQCLYSYTNQTTILLTPVFKHMEGYLSEAHLVGIDETYWSCREKGRNKAPPDGSDNEQTTGRKAQKSKAKTLRSYVFGVVTPEVCLYYHSLERDSNLPKNLLIQYMAYRDDQDLFVVTDAFYKKFFSLGTDLEGNTKTLFQHGACWVHARRYFCAFYNYATHKDGSPTDDIVQNNWEQDIVDAKELRDLMTECFRINKAQVDKCLKNAELDITVLRKEHVKPVIDKIFDKAKAIFKQISIDADTGKPERQCSERLRKAIGYLIRHEKELRAFLYSPYGVMTNNSAEEKFRELDILRNGMLANDSIKGAENLTLIYSLYKTCELHDVDFEAYMFNALTTMMRHQNEIEFIKDNKGTITGIKSWTIPAEVLDGLMPWNMAKQEV